MNTNGTTEKLEGSVAVFEVGDKVLLREDSIYCDGRARNPIGVDGIVLKIYNDGWIKVDWQNGCKNHYEPKDLDLVEKKDIETKLEANDFSGKWVEIESVDHFKYVADVSGAKEPSNGWGGCIDEVRYELEKARCFIEFGGDFEISSDSWYWMTYKPSRGKEIKINPPEDVNARVLSEKLAQDMVKKPNHYQLLPEYEVKDVNKALLDKIEESDFDMTLYEAGWYQQSMQYFMRFYAKNGLEDLEKGVQTMRFVVDSINQRKDNQ